MYTYYFKVEDLLPYVIFIALLFIIIILQKDSKRRLIGFLTVVLFFSCLRYGIGYDYLTYKDLILGFGDKFTLITMEPIAKWLIELSQSIHYPFFFVITSFLIYIPIFIVVKRLSYNPLLSFWIYIFIPLFFLESLSVIRNHVAYSFFFLSFMFFREKKYLKTLLCYLFSIGFHYSTLFTIPIFLLYKFTLKKEYAIILVIASFFVSNFVFSFVSSISSDFYLLDKFADYAERSRGGGDFMAIIINLFMLAVFIKWDRIVELNPFNAKYLTFVCVGVILWNIFSFDYTLRLRLSTYFLLFSIVLIPEYGRVLSIDIELYKRRICVICMMVFFALFFVNIKSNLESHEQLSFLPYRVFLFNNEGLEDEGYFE